MRFVTLTVVMLLLSAGIPTRANGNLLKAVDKENYRKVRALIAAGADVDACYDEFPYSALNEAVGYTPDAMVELLLEADADPEKVCNGMSPVEFAAQKGYTDTLKLLLDAGADPDFGDEIQGTLLHEAIAKAKSAKQVQLLLQAGADPGATTDDGATPLMWAASRGKSAEIVDVLLDAGADLCAKDNAGMTALDYLDDRTDDDVSIEREVRNAVEGQGDEFARCTRQQEQRQEAEEQAARLQRTWERDLGLTESVRHDKYMVALTQHLKQERFDLALGYFDMLERLDVQLAASFDFYYGEALLRTGQFEQAIEKLYEYIQREGAAGDHYGRALELVNEAEAH